MHLPAIARSAAALFVGIALSASMPASQAGLLRRASPHASAPSPYEKAERMREALDARPRQQRTRHEYDKVMDAYRAIYHNDPASPHADSSVSAVAELLAEEGRIFDDEKAFHDAIGQYEFLRHGYPASRLCPNALVNEAAILQRDLKDNAQAKQKYKEFLKVYPHHILRDQARVGLQEIHEADLAEKRAPQSRKSKNIVVEEVPLPAIPSVKSDENGKVAGKPRTTQSSAVPSFPGPLDPPTKVDEASSSTTRANVSVVAQPAKTRHGKAPMITNIRHWSTNVYTRVAIDLDEEVQYEAARVPSPDRIFFDLHGARLSPELIGRSVDVTDDGYLKRIRAAQFSNDVTRIVLDVSDVSDYSAFLLPNPYRLIIDIHGRKPGSPLPSQPLITAANAPREATEASSSKSSAFATKPTTSATASPTLTAPQAASGSLRTPSTTTSTPPLAQSKIPSKDTVAQAIPEPIADHAVAPKQPSTLEEVRSLSHQRNRVKATTHPTTAPIAASVAGTTAAPQQTVIIPPPSPATSAKHSSRKHPPATAAEASANDAGELDKLANGTREASPAANGQRSLVRALGLKIGRIVVDAGHGGHDSGTLGPEGIEEKEVVLDVSLRLGKLLKQRLGADVIYTRDDDTFIPLETRTAIANKAQADLFISVHANSSHDSSARGVETYYLNFTASPDALEVAARENAVSNQSIHQLSDLVKKITLKDKIDESREFAGDVQQSLFTGLEDGNRGLKDRGVKKAPFVVLIGANMPSILAEISFLTNPDDAHELRDPNYRQRIAESLYRGVAKYVGGLSGVHLAQGNARSAGN